jgi:hypothetical protein
MWSSLLLCLFDLLYPFPVFGIPNIGTKTGISLWACGVVTLLFLVNRIALTELSGKTRIHRKLQPFDRLDIPHFGVPFLDDSLRKRLGFGASILFPILLISDRTAHGLAIAQSFLAEGLANGEAVVWLVFTRPWTIAAKQLSSFAAWQRLTSSPANTVIIDCYTSLYLSDEKDSFNHGDLPRITVRHCDPRDPACVRDELKSTLRLLRSTGSTKVRVLYDSLSDFIAVADRELVVSYLRWSIVWEELYGVQSVYLVWPEVANEPLKDPYLSQFGNTVLRVRLLDRHYEAVLDGVTNVPVRLQYDETLECIDVSNFEVNRERTAKLAELLVKLKYQPGNFAEISPFQNDKYRDAHFIFFLTAIDHNTHQKGIAYEARIDGAVIHGSDLMYRLARRAAEHDENLFTPVEMQKITSAQLATIFATERGVLPAGLETRASLLRDAATRILGQYEGTITELFNRSEGLLSRGDGRGILEQLSKFKAYEDPYSKKSFLLIKLLRRKGLVEVHDLQNLNVPVDHILYTIALRSGLITPSTKVRKLITDGTMLSDDIVGELRWETLRAYRDVAERANLAPDEFDDLLWAYGRECFRTRVPFSERNMGGIRTGLEGRILGLGVLAEFLMFITGIDKEAPSNSKMLPMPLIPPTHYF